LDEEDMWEGACGFAAGHAGRNQPPSLVRRARFPFDGANRIRFEDFRDGSCPHLSPTPRVRLNK
jgi:hypothetical protein